MALQRWQPFTSAATLAKQAVHAPAARGRAARPVLARARASLLEQPCVSSISRRAALVLLPAGLCVTAGRRCGAFVIPPPGYRSQVDKLDGYSFLYPQDWTQVTSSGNDIFLRNPGNLDENLFVDISSPSSSRFNTVTDLGTPEQAAQRILDQYINKEFMSTRIGIRREGEILSATQRTGQDGKPYYDVAVRMTSYASRSPYVTTQTEVLKGYGVEWDRVLLTTLGVANKRLYELRLQTANSLYESRKQDISRIMQSFTCQEVDT